MIVKSHCLNDFLKMPRDVIQEHEVHVCACVLEGCGGSVCECVHAFLQLFYVLKKMQ